MKKFCIIALILGLVFITSGLIMIGMFADNMSYIEHAFEGDDGQRYEYYDTIVVTTDGGAAEQFTPSESLHIYEDSYSHYYSSCDIKGIDIKATAADVFIIYGDQLSISGYGMDTKKFTEKINDSGVLEIDYEIDATIADMLDSQKTSIDITVPSGYTFDNISVDIEAGNVSMVNVSAKNFKTELNAGDLQFTDVNISGSSDIKIMAGNVYLYSSELNNTGMKLTAASVHSADGLKLNGNTDIEVITGSVYLYLAGAAEDYSYEISKIAGSFSIDGSDKIPDTTSDNRIKINVTAGDIGIYFND